MKFSKTVGNQNFYSASQTYYTADFHKIPTKQTATKDRRMEFMCNGWVSGEQVTQGIKNKINYYV